MTDSEKLGHSSPCSQTMSSSKDICGSVEYTKMVPVKGITTEKPSTGKIKFRMNFDRSGENVGIWFLSPKLIFLQSVQLKVSVFDLDNWTFVKEDCIVIKERQIVQVNKWHFLESFSSMGSYYLQDRHGKNKILNLMGNGSLRLKFEFVATIDESKEDHYEVPESQLINDFEDLFLDGIYSDVVMKSAEGEEFEVHKAVLASRSAVLKAHFEHNTTESITNIVESPLESEVLRDVLLFIYTDKMTNVVEIPEKLLAAADYYQLSRLKGLCEVVLHKKLTVDNAIDTFQLADLHSANTLKQLTLEFIKDGRQSLITKTEGWTKVQSVELMRAICE